jgi:hypothetical protein
MCDVPSTATFCSEPTECFPGVASKFLFIPFVTVLVAPVVISVIMHFVLHIRCISIHKLLHSVKAVCFFSASFCATFLSAGIATSFSMRAFSFYFQLLYLAYLSLLLCVYLLISWRHIFMLTYWIGSVLAWVRVPFFSPCFDA